MCRRLLVLLLSLTLLFGGILSSFASPSPSDSSVVLSPAEAASIRSALEKSEAALQASNKEIEMQSTQIKLLWIFSGVMVGIDLGAVALGLYEALRK